MTFTIMTSIMQRVAVSGALLTMSLTTTQCSSSTSRSLAERFRLVDPPPAARLNIRALCDHSPLSSCTPVQLRETVQTASAALAQRQGTMAVYALDVAAGIREVARYTTPALLDASTAAQTAYANRVTREAFGALWQPAVFGTVPRRSRILAALSNIAQTTPPAGHEAIIIVLSDLRDTDLIGDCQAVPSTAEFLGQLTRARFLEPGSLRARVLIPYYNISMPAEGCPSNERRALALKDLMTAALQRAGATKVEFTTSAPHF